MSLLAYNKPENNIETLIYFNPDMEEFAEATKSNIFARGLIPEYSESYIFSKYFNYDIVKTAIYELIQENKLCNGIVDKKFLDDLENLISFIIISRKIDIDNKENPYLTFKNSIKTISIVTIQRGLGKIEKNYYLQLICSREKGLGKKHIELLKEMADTLKIPIKLYPVGTLEEDYYKPLGFTRKKKGNRTMRYTPSEKIIGKYGGKRNKTIRKLRRKIRPTRKSRKF